MATILQPLGNLSSRQAGATVVSRLDWRSAPHPPLDYRGFHFRVLSEFRRRLLEAEASAGALDCLLEALKEAGHPLRASRS